MNIYEDEIECLCVQSLHGYSTVMRIENLVKTVRSGEFLGHPLRIGSEDVEVTFAEADCSKYKW